MKTEDKFTLISLAIVGGAIAYGEYKLRKLDRTIKEGTKRMSETKFTLIVPVPPEMPEF